MDMSKYMNKPECDLLIGDICVRDDLLFSDTKYRVLSIIEKNNKFYAVCEYDDEFDGYTKIDEVFANYLRRV